MRKILFATLAATAVIASASAASAQTRVFHDHNSYVASPQQTGGGSLGYNLSIQSLDQVG